MEPRKTFAKNLKQARVDAGLSQEALGQAAGLHMTEISRLERGLRDPRLETMTKLARALDIDLGTLVAGL